MDLEILMWSLTFQLTIPEYDLRTKIFAFCSVLELNILTHFSIINKMSDVPTKLY